MEKIWRDSGFEKPEVYYAVNQETGETYLVIEDDSTIFKFMNKNGQVYVIAAFRCIKYSSESFLEGTPFYSCENIIHPISCSKIENPKEKFVYDRLLNDYL